MQRGRSRLLVFVVGLALAAGCTPPKQPNHCGNRTVEPPEQCDDGNTVEGDGCDTNCTFSACGNGIVSARSAPVVALTRGYYRSPATHSGGTVSILPSTGGQASPLLLPQGVSALSAVSATAYMCVLSTNGEVWCIVHWNPSAGAGLGPSPPREVFTKVALDKPAASLSAYADHTCVVLDGHVRCWGENDQGQLGVGDRDRRNSPGASADVDLGSGLTAQAVTAGFKQSCALLTDGRIKCWGALGPQVLGDEPGEMGDPLPFLPFSRPATAIADGEHGVYAILDDGSVERWHPFYGEFIDRIELGEGVMAVGLAVGMNHSCAVLNNGQLKCWGSNRAGELGLGDRVYRPTYGPLAAVDLGPNAIVVSAACTNERTCAALSDGQVKCWGYGVGDSPGELGAGLPPLVFTSEGCDDGNRQAGDGCNDQCGLESGWSCTGQPSKCSKCGDGKVQAPEECDDGNDTDGDGCNKDCRAEACQSTEQIALVAKGFEHYTSGVPFAADIDGVTSSGAQPGLCKPRSPATADRTHQDEPNGGDNSFVRNVLQPLGALLGADKIGAFQVAADAPTILLTYPRTTQPICRGSCTVYGAAPFEGVPRLDGTDLWSPIAGTSQPATCLVSPSSMDLTPSMDLQWTVREARFSVKLGHARLAVFDGGTRAALSGVLATDELVDAIRAAIGLDPKLCDKDSPVWREVETIIRNAADIQLDGSQTGGDAVPCAGISFGVVLRLYPVVVGPEATPAALAPVCQCGNGMLEGGEACDDGNVKSSDGCASCAIEPGWACSGTPSTCTNTCGNGIVDAGETCDDDKLEPDDGCSAACQKEQGWTCSGAPSVCMTVCGDKLVAGNETCDDGNPDGTDGCSAACKLETGWVCPTLGSACCQLQCGGRECGSDGCGGTCAPGCSGGDACNDASGHCETTLGYPTNVTATTDRVDDVRVAWTTVQGATQYEILRDDVSIGTSTDPFFLDTTATAGTDKVLTGIAASDGAYARYVLVTATTSGGTSGPSYSYKVRAYVGGTWGVDSFAANGSRAANPLVPGELELEIDGQASVVHPSTLVNPFGYLDGTAPPPIATPGTATATSGTSVQLTLSGVSLAPGATVLYRVRRVGDSAWLSDTGFRAAQSGDVFVRWERTLRNSPAPPFYPAPKATGLSTTDPGGYLGASLYYRAVASAGNGPEARSNVVSGSGTTVLGFKKIAVGAQHGCGVSLAGNVSCWGHDEFGQSLPPVGSFSDVVLELNTSCALRNDGAAVCWGKDFGAAHVVSPTGEAFVELSPGPFAEMCGRRNDDSVLCFDTSTKLALGTQPTGAFRSLGNASCGVHTDGSLECWKDFGTWNVPAATYLGPFVTMQPLADGTIGLLRETGNVELLDPSTATTTPLDTNFTQVRFAPGNDPLFWCGLTPKSEIRCNYLGTPKPWVWDLQTGAPRCSPIADLDLQGSACAVDATGKARCWGSDPGVWAQVPGTLPDETPLLGDLSISTYGGNSHWAVDAKKEIVGWGSDALAGGGGGPGAGNQPPRRSSYVYYIDTVESGHLYHVTVGGRDAWYVPTLASSSTAYKPTIAAGIAAAITATAGDLVQTRSVGAGTIIEPRAGGPLPSITVGTTDSHLALFSIAPGGFLAASGTTGGGAAVATSGELALWGSMRGDGAAPAGNNFVAVDCSVSVCCARRTDGTMTCFYGSTDSPAEPGDPPPSVGELLPVELRSTAFRSFSVVAWAVCGVTTSRELRCMDGNRAVLDATSDARFDELGLGSPPPAPYALERIELGEEGSTCAMWRNPGVDDVVRCDFGAPPTWGPQSGKVLRDLSVGSSRFACAIYEPDGYLDCWGFNSPLDTQTFPPGDPGFVNVEAGYIHGCAIKANGQRRCWPAEDVMSPQGPLASVDVGQFGVGQLTRDGFLRGDWYWWHNNEGGTMPSTCDPLGSLTFATVGLGTHSIKLDEETVFGLRSESNPDLVPPTGTYRSIAINQVSTSQDTCGISLDGKHLACWGDATPLPPPPELDNPPGQWIGLAVSPLRACAVDDSGGLACWGAAFETPPPAGEKWLEVALTDEDACGRTVDGRILCWAGGHMPPTSRGHIDLDLTTARLCFVDGDGRAACRYRLGALETEALAGGGFVQISNDFGSICGVRVDGSLDCLGGRFHH